MIFYIRNFFIGMAMGAANVIPGVSGGTIAFITGIYERLINALKSFDVEALKLLGKGRIKDLLNHIDFGFLASMGAGVVVSIISLAKLLEFLLCTYPVLTNAFFFGLIFASVYLVGKEIKKWDASVIGSFVVGTALALSIVFFNPASANANMFYLFICGMVAISSMILPGLSGSYVLLIMGNYLLVIGSINDFFGGDMGALGIMIPFAVGCGIGLLVFSRILAFVFDKYKEPTIGLLTGFVFGSLAVIWPWKETRFMKNNLGEFVDKKGQIIQDVCREGIVLKYDRYVPSLDTGFWFAVGLIILGIILVIGIEKWGSDKTEETA